MLLLMLLDPAAGVFAFGIAVLLFLLYFVFALCERKNEVRESYRRL